MSNESLKVLFVFRNNKERKRARIKKIAPTPAQIRDAEADLIYYDDRLSAEEMMGLIDVVGGRISRMLPFHLPKYLFGDE